MKRKDIISIVVSVAIIVVAVYIGMRMMGIGPKPAANTEVATTTVEKTFTGNIDQDTLNNINKFNDYGEATLDNIGRVNPFAPLN